jgi:hypothetical protein
MTSRLTFVQYFSDKPVLSITPFQNFELQLFANGTIRYQNPQPDGSASIELENPSAAFDIHLSQAYMKQDARGRPPMQKPIISSDGRYLQIRERNDEIVSVLSFEEAGWLDSFEGGRWQEWRFDDPEPGYFSLLQAGVENYRQLGKTFFAALVLLFGLAIVVVVLVGIAA